MKCSVVQDVIHFSDDNLENMVQNPNWQAKNIKEFVIKLLFLELSLKKQIMLVVNLK